MIIHEVHVRNYRCILDETLVCEPLTALVGPNGCGKSTFLTALQLFFAESPRIAEDDFYARECDSDIEITVTFNDVSKALEDQYSIFVHNGQMRLSRFFSHSDPRRHGAIYGWKQSVDAFRVIREATNATEAKKQYEELRQRSPFDCLPRWTSQPAVIQELNEWEQAHPKHLSLGLDSGSFFNLGKGDRGDIRRLIQFVFVPAVSDASDDALDSKGSAATELFDILVRSKLAERSDYITLRDHVREKYDGILKQAEESELVPVKSRLTESLGMFVPGSGVTVRWVAPAPFELPLPRAEILLDEDGFSSSVGRTGHGMQRAFTLALLQELAASRNVTAAGEERAPDPDTAETGRTLILAIEEPELFQHPNRQRSIARLLDNLTKGNIRGAADRTQVIHATHNPHFIGIDRFHQVRVLRKRAQSPRMPRATHVQAVNPKSVVDELQKATSRKYLQQAWEVIQAKLISIMTPLVNEGFFADGVVLVEGDIDRAAVLAASRQSGLELEDRGISVIPCGGKASISRPLVIFRQFGLPTYVIWDADKSPPDQKENFILQKLVECPVVDALPTQVTDSFACFEDNLEVTVRSELGDFYDEFANSCKEEFGASLKDGAIKHPVVFEELLRRASARGFESTTLQQIVGKISSLA